jgi:hypothetical protein
MDLPVTFRSWFDQPARLECHQLGRQQAQNR